jgi:TusA-related sulfurtransferase
MRRFDAALLALFMTAPALAAPPPREMTGARERGMRNCPSTVAGAVTAVDDRPEGVLLRVTAPNPSAQAEIRKRAKRQANIAMQPARSSIEHTGEGTGSGEFGYCPGMQQGTVIHVDEIPAGAAIRVMARNPNGVRPLQRSTRSRVEQLQNHR